MIAKYVPVILVAIIVRLLFATVYFNGIFGFGDSYRNLLRSEYFISSKFESTVTNLYVLPILMPLTIGFFSKLTFLNSGLISQLIVSLISVFGIVFFCLYIEYISNYKTAILSGFILSVLPMYSLLSTEPVPETIVMSLFFSSLYYLYVSQNSKKYFIVALICGLLASVHTTGIIFVGLLLALLLINFYYLHKKLSTFTYLIIILFPIISILIWIILGKIHPVASLSSLSAIRDGKNEFIIIQYLNVLRQNFVNGFQSTAGFLYIEGVISQIGELPFFMSLLGIIFIFKRGIKRNFPIVVWGVLITVFFMIQYPSKSHLTRYPNYVIPVFIYLFSISINILCERSSKLVRNLVLILIVMVIAVDCFGKYYNTSKLRNIYYVHKNIGTYLASSNLLDSNNKILYLDWPSISYYLNMNKKRDESIITFGWERSLAELDWLNKSFLMNNKVKFYLYDHVSQDYINTADITHDRLANLTDINLEEIQTFRDPRSNSRYITLYKINYISF